MQQRYILKYGCVRKEKFEARVYLASCTRGGLRVCWSTLERARRFTKAQAEAFRTKFPHVGGRFVKAPA